MIAGRRRRPGLDLGRRRKPRVALWAVLLVVLAIVIGEVTADVVNSGGTSAEVAAKSYAAAVVPIIEESTTLRLWLTDVRHHAGKLGRLGVETALGRLVTGTHNLERQLANLGIAPPSQRAGRLLSDVLTRRATAARLVMGGVSPRHRPVPPDATGATAILAQAGAEMAGSDRDYARFVSTLPPYVRRTVSLPSTALGRSSGVDDGRPRRLRHLAQPVGVAAHSPVARDRGHLARATGAAHRRAAGGRRLQHDHLNHHHLDNDPAWHGDQFEPARGDHHFHPLHRHVVDDDDHLQVPPAGSAPACSRQAG